MRRTCNHEILVMTQYKFADLHCHPNLKTFGQSFSKSSNKGIDRSDLWFQKTPNVLTIFLQKLSGITRFSQADFTTMSQANVKLAFVSLYPFEKGFFTHRIINPKISASLASFITSIGYNRVRNIQQHCNYFQDLIEEYLFLLNGSRERKINDINYSWEFHNILDDLNFKENEIKVIPTIEGAHVFNTGLKEYGITLNKSQIIENIRTIKALKHPPLFITLAHNFNNDICGHASSLKPLGALVDQSYNLNAGISELGYEVISQMLSFRNGNPILIDIKHMSLKARLEYYNFLKIKAIETPIIVSHGAITGTSLRGASQGSLNPNFFVDEAINFYDEELVKIAKSNGLFAIQLDAKRLAPNKLIKKGIFERSKEEALNRSVLIIWRQIQHIAEVLDAKNLSAWDTCCIGSDFDGTINPLGGIWTSQDFQIMANKLEKIVRHYLNSSNNLKLKSNKEVDPKEVIEKFTLKNAVNFLTRSRENLLKDRIKTELNFTL